MLKSIKFIVLMLLFINLGLVNIFSQTESSNQEVFLQSKSLKQSTKEEIGE